MEWDHAAVAAWASLFAEAAMVSFGIAVGAMTISVMLGLPIALLRVDGSPLSRRACATIIWALRNVPELPVLYALIFSTWTVVGLGGPGSLATAWVAALGLGMLQAGAAAETWRAGLTAIPIEQVSAARAIGLGRWQTLALIRIPSALQAAQAGWANHWVAQLKATAFLSVFAVPDVLFIAQTAGHAWAAPFSAYALAAALFLALSALPRAATTGLIPHRRSACGEQGVTAKPVTLGRLST